MGTVGKLTGSRIVVVIAAALAVAAVGGVAWAAIPDAGGVIHGCYDQKGALRVIDPATDSCKNNETALDWSQQGPQGIQGIQGIQGEPGEPGEPASTQFAVLDKDGNVLGSKGLDPALPTGKSFTGFYTVAFADPVDGCAILATADARYQVGPITAAYALVNLASPYQVGVATYGAAGLLVDQGFSLAVIC